MPRGVPRIPEPWEWVRTKRCTCCDEVKPWARFSPACYWPDGSVRRVESLCHVCRARRSRALQRRARRRGVSPERHAYRMAWQRRRRAELRSERRRAAETETVISAPLRAALLAAEARFDTHQEMAAILEVDATTLARLLNGRLERVALVTADRVLTRLGWHLYDVYPELMEVV